MTKPCPHLGMDGHNHPANPCETCKGTGEIESDEHLCVACLKIDQEGEMRNGEWHCWVCIEHMEQP